MVEHDGHPVLKLSSGKKTWVGKKQVFRYHDEDGRMREDLLGLMGEDHPEGEPLIETVISNGRLVCPLEPLGVIRDRFAEERERLPLAYQQIHSPPKYPVKISSALRDLDERTASEKAKQEITGKIGSGCI